MHQYSLGGSSSVQDSEERSSRKAGYEIMHVDGEYSNFNGKM